MPDYEFVDVPTWPNKNQDRDTFNTAVGDLVTFMAALPGFKDWVEQQRDDVLQTALAGDLPSPAGLGSKILFFQGDETGVSGADALGFGGSVSGTPDAIVLTTPLDMPLLSLVAGQHCRFIPLADNTGAATLKVDANDPKTLQTVIGSALPAGYLVAGKPVDMVFDGVVFVVRRAPEYGTTAAGHYLKDESGVMQCWGMAASLASDPDAIVVLPHEFADNTYSVAGAAREGTDRSVTFPSGGRTVAQFTLQSYDASAGTESAADVDWQAVGRWFNAGA